MITSFKDNYNFLSNFYYAPFTFMGNTYDTNEHFFQSAKGSNIDTCEEIRNALTPGMAKRLGKKCEIRQDWDNIKLNVMRLGLHLKFQNPGLKISLLKTRNHKLIEGNTWGDEYWGMVYEPQLDLTLKWVGSNHLGILLMELREEIENDIG